MALSRPRCQLRKASQKHTCRVGYKAHSLITINGIPMVSLLSGAHERDSDYISLLLEELGKRYPNLSFSYISLDRGHDSEEIHRGIYEDFDIIPGIIRKSTLITYVEKDPCQTKRNQGKIRCRK